MMDHSGLSRSHRTATHCSLPSRPRIAVRIRRLHMWANYEGPTDMERTFRMSRASPNPLRIRRRESRCSCPNPDRSPDHTRSKNKSARYAAPMGTRHTTHNGPGRSPFASRNHCSRCRRSPHIPARRSHCSCRCCNSVFHGSNRTRSRMFRNGSRRHSNPLRTHRPPHHCNCRNQPYTPRLRSCPDCTPKWHAPGCTRGRSSHSFPYPS